MTDSTVSRASGDSQQQLVELRQIEKSYGGVPVLKKARLAVGAAEIHGLVGENGAGKSTLVKTLAGEVPGEGGEILWLGTPVKIHSRADADHLGITMIHQELNLAPHLTVAENIFLGHEPGRWGLVDNQREVDDARASLQQLEFDLDPRAPVRRLSPAQAQLVEIARAVVRARRLVIMDEPTSSLSAREVAELFGVVRQLKAQGVAVIFVTHRLEELAQIADRVTVLRDGETVHEGAMPRHDFGGLIRAMVGRELKDFFPPRAFRPGDVALEVDRLGRGTDFFDVTFAVRKGEIVGLAGLVGAGRTEVAEAIFGARPSDRGHIRVEGKEAAIRSPRDAIRRGLALITEDRKRTGLAMNLPLAQNITLADLGAIVRRGLLDLDQEEKRARGFLDRLRIRARSTTQKVARLSGGNQQKVVLAKWLFRRARVLIFDEPTRGVDVGAKTEIYGLMNELAESGAAILMISSELPEILGMTDRVLVMRNGRLVKELVTARTTQEEIMRYATLAELQDGDQGSGLGT
ncbi:MAG: sugar ABC transporter ATP-binding protein [Acidobacteria bacterium]|nr:sugar ABC transporter ATP-binding protein [Acidobacteriota bacterium]